jgi:hypothetical protein
VEYFVQVSTSITQGSCFTRNDGNFTEVLFLPWRHVWRFFSSRGAMFGGSFPHVAPCSEVLFLPWRHVRRFFSSRGAMFGGSFPHVAPCLGVLFLTWRHVRRFFSSRGAMFGGSFPHVAPCSGVLFPTWRHVRGFFSSRGAMLSLFLTATIIARVNTHFILPSICLPRDVGVKMWTLKQMLASINSQIEQFKAGINYLQAY